MVSNVFKTCSPRLAARAPRRLCAHDVAPAPGPQAFYRELRAEKSPNAERCGPHSAPGRVLQVVCVVLAVLRGYFTRQDICMLTTPNQHNCQVSTTCLLDNRWPPTSIHRHIQSYITRIRKTSPLRRESDAFRVPLFYGHGTCATPRPGMQCPCAARARTMSFKRMKLLRPG